MPGRIELWAADVNPEHGGVEAYASFLRKALVRIAGEQRVRARVKAGDVASTGSPLPSSQPRSTPAFALELLGGNCLRHSGLIVSTHLHFAPAAWLLNWFRPQPYVIAAHGIEVWGRLSWLRRRALAGAARIWAVSRHTRERVILEQNIPAAKVIVLPDTFDEARFTPGPVSEELRRRYALAPSAKLIFSVGRLAASERYKGFDRVIAALPAIRRAVPAVHYLIAGRGDDRPRLEALARSAGVADRVIFAGFVPSAELCDHYRLCDVFAMPSTGEGFGIVFLEAMACGKPVLAGNADGSTEPLQDGRFGALVNPLDVPAISAAITNILTGCYPVDLMRQPQELRRQVIAEFGFDRFCERVREALECYPQLLSSPASP